MSDNSKVESTVFSQPIRTLDPSELEQVVGGFPLEGGEISGPKDQGGNDNQNRRAT